MFGIAASQLQSLPGTTHNTTHRESGEWISSEHLECFKDYYRV